MYLYYLTCLSTDRLWKKTRILILNKRCNSCSKWTRFCDALPSHGERDTLQLWTRLKRCCKVFTFETFYFSNKALFWVFITYMSSVHFCLLHTVQEPWANRPHRFDYWLVLPERSYDNVFLFNQWNRTFTTQVPIFVQSPRDFWGSGRMRHVDNTVRKVWNLITQSQVTPNGAVSF